MDRAQAGISLSACSAALLLMGLLDGAAGRARADVITCPASKDNTLFQYIYDPPNPNVLPSSNGAGAWFAAGRTRGGQIQRGLLQFDLSRIPAGATITSATLDLHVVGVPNADIQNEVAQRSFWLKPLVGSGEPPWGEGSTDAGTGSGTGQGAPAELGDATWLHKRYDSVPWPAGSDGALGPALLDPGVLGTPAGIVPQILVETPDPPELVTWTNSPMAIDVQAWIEGTIPNDGWVVIGEETNSEASKGSKRQFASREHVDQEGFDYRPKLTVQYTLPSQPPTWVWNGGAQGEDRWSVAANWGGTAPAAGAILQFATAAPDAHTSNRNDFQADTRFSGIVFPADTPAYDLQGNRIQLTGAVKNLSRNDQTIGLDVRLTSGGGTFDDRSNNLSVAGAVSGAGPLVKTGTGMLILSGLNTYTGGTVVNGGTLMVTNVLALPAGRGLTIESGGTLVLGSGLSATAGAAGVNATPEPSTLTSFTFGMAVGLAAWLRRRTKK